MADRDWEAPRPELATMDDAFSDTRIVLVGDCDSVSTDHFRVERYLTSALVISS